MILFSLLMILLAQPTFAQMAPNEHFPAVGSCVYDRVQPGRVYVSTGTDRAFMGAAKTKAGALYVIDMNGADNTDVFRFAHINRALIAASANSAEYRHLRLEASFDEWKAAAAKFTQKEDQIYKEAISYPDSWNWWNTQVRQDQSWGGGFQLLAAQPSSQPDPSKEPFTGFNYLWDEGLFQNLKALASAHTIWAGSVDLSDNVQLGSVVYWVRSHQMKFGAFDTADIPDDSIADDTSFLSYIAYFAAHSEPDTVFLNTGRTDDNNVSDPDHFHGWWSYYGFTADQFNGASTDQIAATIELGLEVIWPHTQRSQFECRFNQQIVGGIWNGSFNEYGNEFGSK